MQMTSRVRGIEESATLSVANKARKLRAEGVNVIDLSVGEPDFDSPPETVTAAKAALDRGMTRYTANAGILELRQGLAAYYADRYGSPWTADLVQVTVGAKMALFELAMALFEAGDEVVLPSPYWVSLPEQIRFAGGRPVFVPSSPDDGFRIHPDALLAAVTERTRAVLINSPCNPTGGMIQGEDLHRLAHGCAERGIFLIADETYERFVFDGQEPVSAAAVAAELPETVILVGSFSKTFAMTGWRLGYCLAPSPVIRAIGNIQSHATSNPTSFAMAGAAEALRLPEAAVSERIAEFEARRDLLVPMLNEIPGVQCPEPAGAFYAFPHIAGCYREGCNNSVQLADKLIDEARVAVVPGVAFGREDHVRLSFACSQDELREAVARMHRVLGSTP